MSKRAQILHNKLHLANVQWNTQYIEQFLKECFPSRWRYYLNIDTYKKISFFRRCWTQVAVPFAVPIGKQQTRTDRRVIPKEPFSLYRFSFEMDIRWTVLVVYYHEISPFIFWHYFFLFIVSRQQTYLTCVTVVSRRWPQRGSSIILKLLNTHDICLSPVNCEII